MIIRANAKSIPLRDGSVHCVVTSPPYFGLRKYEGVPDQWWDGDPECDHEKSGEGGYVGHRGNRGQVPQTKWKTNENYPQHKDDEVESGKTCSKCGAWFGQLGLEPTPSMYVSHLVQIFREVWRVLRDDGTVWLNLGDSFASDDKWGGSTGGKHAEGLHGDTGIGRTKKSTGLKSKDLIGIPWMTAFALRTDGWYLRHGVIWEKKNCMPESVTDRPTTSHETVFLLSKKPRYFYDAEAIKEQGSEPDRIRNDRIGGASWQGRQQHPEGGVSTGHATRNARSVWTIPTQPSPEPHFAIMAPGLALKCILAGTSAKGCCPKCKAPWIRVVEKTAGETYERGSCLSDHRSLGQPQNNGVHGVTAGPTRTLGWQKNCECLPDAPEPCIVLDPFGGIGTVASMAKQHGREGISLDLSAKYVRIAKKRAGHGVQTHLFP